MQQLQVILLFAIFTILHAQLPSYITIQRTPTAQSTSSRRIGCSSIKSGYDAPVECMINFLEEQLVQHGQTLSLPQTYRIGWDFVPPVIGSDGSYPQNTGHTLSLRSDVYDASVAAILFMNTNRLDLAKAICDSLVLVTDLDIVGDGRSRASYSNANLVNANYNPNVATTYFGASVDNTVSTGNMAFMILALGRFYWISKDYKYLKTATKIANFIHTNLIVNLPWGGYSAGYTWNGATDIKVGYRSVEHNIDVYAAARLLLSITNNTVYSTMMTHSQRFVQAMWNPTTQNYMVGTVADSKGNQVDVWNTFNLPTDAQTWKVLAEVDNVLARNRQALQWVQRNTVATETVTDVNGVRRSFLGVLFAAGGTGIQIENTAGAAMAFFKAGGDLYASDPTTGQNFFDQAGRLANNLLQVQQFAVNTDGHGLVAAVNPNGAKVWPGNEFLGQSWRYFNVMHCAATAWTGLAIQMVYGRDRFANPYADYTKATSVPVYSRSEEQDTTPKITIGSYSVTVVTISVITAVFCCVVTIALCAMNMMLMRENRNKKIMSPHSDLRGLLSPVSPETPTTPQIEEVH